MLAKCANEACATRFRHLREGKLFQVETEFAGIEANENPLAQRRRPPTRRIEHFWLCEECSHFLTLTFDHASGVITVPLANGDGQKTVRLIHPSPQRLATSEVRISAG